MFKTLQIAGIVGKRIDALHLPPLLSHSCWNWRVTLWSWVTWSHWQQLPPAKRINCLVYKKKVVFPSSVLISIIAYLNKLMTDETKLERMWNANGLVYAVLHSQKRLLTVSCQKLSTYFYLQCNLLATLFMIYGRD